MGLLPGLRSAPTHQTLSTDDEDEAGPVGDDSDEEDEDGSEGEEDEVGLSYLMKEGIQVSPRGRARVLPRA